MCVREGWFDVWVQAPVAKTTLPDNLGMLHVQMWLGCLSEGRCLKLNLDASELQAPYVCYKWYDEGCYSQKLTMTHRNIKLYNMFLLIPLIWTAGTGIHYWIIDNFEWDEY